MNTRLQKLQFWVPVFNFHTTKVSLNNDHLSTTTTAKSTILGSWGWTLYTGLNVFSNSSVQYLEILIFTLQIDQTSLSNKFCKIQDDEFLQAYNIPYTKLNCEIFANSHVHHNCSLSSYYGVLKSKKNI